MASKRKKNLDDIRFADETDKEAIALEDIFEAIKDHQAAQELFAPEPPLIPAGTAETAELEKYFLSIKDNSEFIERFKELNYEQREIILLAILDRYHFGDKNVEIKNKYATQKEDKQKAILALEECGMTWVQKMHYPLHRQEKHIIRIDFYGTVNKPRDDQLSDAYKMAKNTPGNNYALEEYNIRQSPVWKLFRHSKSFRLIEKKVVRKLHEMQINPKVLKYMNAYDYSDILYKTFASPNAASNNASVFLGARQRFVKDFIRNNEAAFQTYLDRTGVDPRYSKALIHSMRTKGVTSNITPLNDTYTPEIIKALQKHKIDIRGLNEKTPLAEEHINFLKSKKLHSLLVAKDKDGNPLTGPSFSVHHKMAVQDGSEQPNLAEVNYFQNLCLVVDVPYHRDILHGMDETSPFNDREAYSARIYINRKDTVFIGGLSPEDQIYYDYTNDPRTIRRRHDDEPQEDWKHLDISSPALITSEQDLDEEHLQEIIDFRNEYRQNASNSKNKHSAKKQIKRLAKSINATPQLIKKILNNNIKTG